MGDLISKQKIISLKDRFYASEIDGTTLLRSIVCQKVHPSDLILDLGAGKGKPKTDFRNFCKIVIGIDVDKHIQDNSFISYGLQGRIELLPFKDGCFDAIFADYVLEHLRQPMNSIKEVLRVLKPGGYFIFRTPNLWHYTSLVGYLSPHWVHKMVANRFRGTQNGKEDEIFETAYKLNTRHKVKTLFQEIGFIY